MLRQNNIDVSERTVLLASACAQVWCDCTLLSDTESEIRIKANVHEDHIGVVASRIKSLINSNSYTINGSDITFAL